MRKKKDSSSAVIDDFLVVIDQLKSGKKRACNICGEVKDSQFFPYKTRNECYLCYERKEGKTLHSFRQSLGLSSANYTNRLYKSVTQPKPKKTSFEFQREIPVEDILRYLRYRKDTGQPAKIYYKDDITFRTFHNFSFTKDHLYIPSGKGYNYTYLISRIRNVEL